MEKVRHRFNSSSKKVTILRLATDAISVIIPTLNEAPHLAKAVHRLRENGGRPEIIVVDGGSTDGTQAIAESLDVKLIAAGKALRPLQLNCGAEAATNDLLYFVHADTVPPADYADQIIKKIQLGAAFGGFRFRFDSGKRALKFTSYFTRFPVMMVRGGDQSMFITKALFDKIGGFDTKYVVMEEYDLIIRAKRHEKFTLIQDDVIVSARKYDINSYPRVNIANFVVFSLFYCGVHPVRLSKIYKRMLHHPKG